MKTLFVTDPGKLAAELAKRAQEIRGVALNLERSQDGGEGPAFASAMALVETSLRLADAFDDLRGRICAAAPAAIANHAQQATERAINLNAQ